MDFNLADAGGGAVAERFESAMTQLIANVMDLNTDPVKKRKIIVSFEYTPGKQERSFGDWLTTVDTKLAPMAPLMSGLSVGINHSTGEMNAREHVQMSLFGNQPVSDPGDNLALADDLAKQETGGKITAFRKQAQ